MRPRPYSPHQTAESQAAASSERSEKTHLERAANGPLFPFSGHRDGLADRRTVTRVNHETARRLAEAERLSPSLQRRLWRVPNLWVRRTLAARADLVDELQALAITDDELIGAWASRERDGALLSAAIDNAVSEASLMALIAQSDLDESQVAALARKATTMSGWHLLDHHTVPLDLAVPLVHRYIKATEQADTPGRSLTERLCREPALLAAVADVVTWKQAGFLRTIAGEVTRHPELIDPLIAALTRLDRDIRTRPREAHAVRSVSRSVEEMLRSTAISVSQLTALSNLPVLADLRSQIDARIRVDVAGSIAGLTCTPSSECARRTAKHHARILTRLGRHFTHPLPAAVAVEAALHRAHLADTVFTDIVQPLAGSVARTAAVELATAGRVQELAGMVRVLGTTILSDVPDATAVYTQLAREGDRVLTDRSVPAQFRTVVIAAYRPLQQLLGHPQILSEVLARIEALPPAVADTALGLLDGWEGDLNSLLTAACELSR